MQCALQMCKHFTVISSVNVLSRKNYTLKKKGDIVKQEWALPEEMGARRNNFKQNPANQNSNRAQELSHVRLEFIKRSD